MTTSRSSEPAAGRVVVATYNVRRCRGRWGRCDLERTAAAIRELDADVVGLQEVDSDIDPREAPDQLRRLASATGMACVAAPAWTRGDGGYGNGLLTRLPVVSMRRHDLSVGRAEPRGALEVDLLSGATPVKVITTHFGLFQGERRRQDEILRELVSRLDAPIVIVMGDFNEWYPFSSLFGALDRMLGRAPAHRTFPAWLPVLPLDRIWVRPRSALVEEGPVKSRLVRRASDHLPVRVVIACPPPRPPG